MTTTATTSSDAPRTTFKLDPGRGTKGIKLNQHEPFSMQTAQRGIGSQVGNDSSKAFSIQPRNGMDHGLPIERSEIRFRGSSSFDRNQQQSDLLAGKNAKTVHNNLQELVSQALIHPLFQLMNNDPLKSGLFKSGGAEKTLRPVLEGQIAKSIASDLDPSLIDNMARRLLRSGQSVNVPDQQAPVSALAQQEEPIHA